ncbi:MAG: xanthine dehydrogenase accessory protein XdhC [Candidatus Sericytochromatia bacterium]
MITFYNKILELLNTKTPFVSITLVDTIGSVPQNQGSKMLVTANGLFYGTIGGGKVEKKSIDEALKLLDNQNKEKALFYQWNLNKDVGMTCGGTVKLFFEVFNQNNWNIVIFGAGHVSNAIIPILSKLDCQITCIDPREEWLEKILDVPNLKKICILEMKDYVSKIPENSFVILMTMGHTTDKPILLEILKTRSFPYIGVIGSKAKANILYKDIKEAGLPEDTKNLFYCPIGLDIGTNDVNEIAISVIAQLIQERDLYLKK